jgi:iron complex outermembrane receptor protein
MKALILSAASVIAIAATASPALAQSEDDAARSAMGDDIVVTARRVEERLQDVPIAVTAISGENLQKLGIKGPLDLKTAVAGLVVNSAAGRTYTPIYAMRGQRAGDQVFTQDPPVAIYQDEVLISPLAGSNAGLFDLENVQVVKGPQGTLFGRNNTGGAVLYTSARPKDELGAKVELGYANYDSWIANGYLNLPVSEAIRLRAAVDYRKQGGFGNVTAGPDAGADAMGSEQIAGRLSIAIDPTDRLKTLTVIGYSHYKDEGGPAFHILDTPRPTGNANFVFNTNFVVPGNAGLLSNAIATQRAQGRFDYQSGSLQGAESKVFTATNTITYELSDTLTLKNVFGYRHLDTWDAADYDGTLLPILQATNSARAKTYSEELQLQGTAFDERLNFIFGVYLFDQRGIEGTGTPFMDVRNQLPGTVAFGGAARLQFVRIKNQSFSGFGQVGFKITDALTLNAGLRYSVDRRSSTSTVGTVSKTVFNNNHPVPITCEYRDAAGNPLPATYADCRVTGKTDFSQPSWLIGLDWKADDDTLVYIASRHSYRSGGFQSRPFDNTTAQLPFSPEKVTDLEIGLKRDWDLGGDNRLRTNIAAYYQWYSDIQRNNSTLTPVGIGNITRNAAKAHIYGLEFESELRLGSLARVAFNYAYVKPKYDKFPTQIFDPVLRVFVPQDRTSYKWPYISTHQLNGSLTLTPDVGSAGDLSLTVNAYYQSKFTVGDDYFDAASLNAITANAPLPADVFYAAKGYTVVNARAQLDNVGGSGFSAGVWAKNLFNKSYFDSGVLFQDSIGFGTGIFGAPRTYGIDISYKF